MSFWNQLKEQAGSLAKNLGTEVAKFKNNDFASASMAVCALISAADGSIEPAEKQKTTALIMNNSVLSIFAPSDLKVKFDHFCDKLNNDFDFGKIEAIQAIAKLKTKPDQARAIIQIGIIIGSSDGNFDDSEKKALKEACLAVGINPTEYEL
jgi:tellurite resistance protein TerB